MKIPRSLTNLLVGAEMLGIAAGGCVNQRSYLIPTEINEIRYRIQTNYDEESRKMVSNEWIKNIKNYLSGRLSTGEVNQGMTLEELSTEEVNQWIKKQLPKLFKERDEPFMDMFIIYCDNEKIKDYSYKKLTKRQKLELYYLKSASDSFLECLPFWH
ncbi:MAG: hypothetical protein AABX30_00855 [Nanoarchaeota archaeon]